MKLLADYNICGIDEVGRGCLAGVVCASVVMFKGHYKGCGLKDSKELSAGVRHEKSLEIKENSYFSIATASVDEIDRINILQATFLAMRRAVDDLEKQLSQMESRVELKDSSQPLLYVIDGRDRIPDFGNRLQKSLVRGDSLVKQISAASILAKVHRDQMMIELDQKYPEYGFCKHKGYGTKVHLEALHQFGVTPWHRKSFAPVREVALSRAD